MKPNLVDKTCELLKWLCNYRNLHNTATRAVMVIFPLAPGQTIAQMWSNGARGGTTNCVYRCTAVQSWRFVCQIQIVVSTEAFVRHGVCDEVRGRCALWVVVDTSQHGLWLHRYKTASTEERRRRTSIDNNCIVMITRIFFIVVVICPSTLAFN